jgi:outer membrane lipoprotein-sorting protein
MKPVEDIRWRFRQSTLSINRDRHEAIFAEILRAQEQSGKTKPAGSRPTNWRRIMKSPLTKLAIASAVIIAGAIGLSFWRTTGSNVALADVLTQIQQFNAYRYQSTVTRTGLKVGDKTVDEVTHSTILISRDGSWKMTMNREDPNGARKNVLELYVLAAKKMMLQLMPEAKRYAEVELDEARLQDERERNSDPRAIIQGILDCNYVSLGRSMIDGLEVEGFETTDPRYMGRATGQADVKVWVDVKTQLPVRLETDVQNGQMHVHKVDDKFQWDIPVHPEDFQPVIPPDYTPMTNTPMKFPPMTEETLMKGFRVFAEMTDRYPDELNGRAISAKLEDLFVREYMGDVQGTSQEEALKKLMADKEVAKKWLDKTIPVTTALMFYNTLVQSNKAPAYYGKTVTPEDGERVLLRWKVSDTEYRVIFGDLHAETVSPEKLAELEKVLPK